MAESTAKSPLIKRIKTAVRHKLDQHYIDGFHKVYYNSSFQTWASTYWLGVQVLKCPLDLFIFQEIIFEVKPDLIIETGTWNGGSAFFFASLYDMLNKGKVITIDIEEKRGRPEPK
jgi:cephalosporin hydroxylase